MSEQDEQEQKLHQDEQEQEPQQQQEKLELQKQSEESITVEQIESSPKISLVHHRGSNSAPVVAAESYSKFEYTPELDIFDRFNIELVHGWVLDPQQCDVAQFIEQLTYNQLVEKIITAKNGEDQELLAQGPAIPAGDRPGLPSPARRCMGNLNNIDNDSTFMNADFRRSDIEPRLAILSSSRRSVSLNFRLTSNWPCHCNAKREQQFQRSSQQQQQQTTAAAAAARQQQQPRQQPHYQHHQNGHQQQ
uniref:Ubiquitin carboxyl-terminal hydrolase n=1 Tax=Macrostomum lignano TaxID=282301 RepID=A0A1I8FQI3_9PLAT